MESARLWRTQQSAHVLADCLFRGPLRPSIAHGSAIVFQRRSSSQTATLRRRSSDHAQGHTGAATRSHRLAHAVVACPWHSPRLGQGIFWTRPASTRLDRRTILIDISRHVHIVSPLVLLGRAARSRVEVHISITSDRIPQRRPCSLREGWTVGPDYPMQLPQWVQQLFAALAGSLWSHHTGMREAPPEARR